MHNVTRIARVVAADEGGKSLGLIGKHGYMRRENEWFKMMSSSIFCTHRGIGRQMCENLGMFLRGTDLKTRARVMVREQVLQRIRPAHGQSKQKLIPAGGRLVPGGQHNWRRDILKC
jgi:hypothetical protein